MSLRAEIERLYRAGAKRIYAKALAANDNSKNQIYLGGSLEAVSLLPTRGIEPDPENANRLKGALDFVWLMDSGQVPAPGAQLILYPDYPEVRLSGVLKNTRGAPNEIIASRTPGRVLLVAVTESDKIVARALGAESEAAREFLSREDVFAAQGVFRELPLPDEGDKDGDGFVALMSRLATIHHKGWIRSWSLGSDGRRRDCEFPQCGGYTLEAELGIARNGRSEPDFRGWEIKSHDVGSIDEVKLGAKPVTLMTPEPTGGLYKDDFDEFWKLYSYPDRSGRPGRTGRRNFGGIYRCNGPAYHLTGLRLELQGVDSHKGTFSATSQLSLVDDQRRINAASWSIAALTEKWSRKHSRAAFVPVERRADASRQYRYASTVHLGRDTGVARLLLATAAGAVYLDPAIKNVDGEVKKRNQFRTHLADLSTLYEGFSAVSVLASG